MAHDYTDANTKLHVGPYDSTLESSRDWERRTAYGVDTPTPESDSMPEFTKFILKAGEVYGSGHYTHQYPDGSVSERSRQKKVLEFINEYFCKKFAEVLKKEFKIK